MNFGVLVRADDPIAPPSRLPALLLQCARACWSMLARHFKAR